MKQSLFLSVRELEKDGTWRVREDGLIESVAHPELGAHRVEDILPYLPRHIRRKYKQAKR